jgi:hypothetical protein
MQTICLTKEMHISDSSTKKNDEFLLQIVEEIRSLTPQWERKTLGFYFIEAGKKKPI